MTLTDATFDVADIGLDPIEGGTSILLTGEDADALEAVFYRLTATDEGEHSVLLATDSDGRSVKRTLGSVRRGADDRTSVLAARTRGRDDDVTDIDDVADLTGVGMELSRQFAEADQQAEGLRAGIMLGSTLCSAAEDTRSVYRFLNSNFLSELRRNGAVGVCAINTSSDIGADIDSIVTGMETSFAARIHVEKTGHNEATLDVSGLPGSDETVEVAW